MKDTRFTVKENTPLTPLVLKMVLKGDTSGIKAGQFVNIKLPGKYLRRPISVNDVNEDYLTIIYKVVGSGTLDMSNIKEGQQLEILTGLGNGYDTSKSGNTPLLIGGGVGVPPLYLLAKELLKENKKPTVILGFNNVEEVFYEKEFKELGIETIVTTVDGTYGLKGFVTDAIKEDYSYVYTCGPLPMLRAVYSHTNVSGQYSFEARMGCGYGACMGCAIETNSGNKRVCKDGPVFVKEDIKW